MKKLLLLILIAFLISCDKHETAPEPEPIDLSKTFIRIDKVEPPSGSTVSRVDEIKITISYNIAPDELELMGFHISYWSKSDNKESWVSNTKRNLSKKNETYEHVFKIIHTSSFPENEFHYKLSISRKRNENFTEIIAQSDPILFKIK